MRISDWSSDVCSSDLLKTAVAEELATVERLHGGEAAAGFERAVRVCGERRQFWARFCDMPAVDLDTADLARVWRGAREVVMAALRAKQGVPLERMMLSAEAQAAIAAFEEVRQRVAALNDHLQAANAAIRLVKEQAAAGNRPARSEEHTSELQSLMRISYAVF